MFRRFTILLIFTLFTLNLGAQASEDSVLYEPVFPEEVGGLIYIEGEDAVSTNFANQAVSNFGCSGYRSIQLNRNTGLQGGTPFYAEFVFFVEEAGEYEFWYGGTPPGPADELIPSYASPFFVSIDGGPQEAVYREDVNVIEGYSPSYYWNKSGKYTFSEGSHRLRIEVSEKRGYDGKFFFYLDSLFFINRDRVEGAEQVKQEVFPSVLESSKIDNPFLSINDYQNFINKNPDDMSAYIELSLVYSLLGDYQSALKSLNRAMALDSTDPYPVVLAAKNRLWKGDVRESLGLYDRALTLNPEDRVLWTEAGKVAAWMAEYDRSIDFFSRGLENFPGDLNLIVNLGLTYLWMARDVDADNSFNDAFDAASGSPELLSRLGAVEEAAGYPEYARDVYSRSIDLYPAYLEFYLLLQSSFLRSGDRESADETGRLILSTFRKSDRLVSELEIYNTKLNLRDDVINSYIEKLHEQPGNLELRQELAQTYFWNGMDKEAMEQIRLVLATHSYLAAEVFTRRNAELFSLADRTAAAASFFENLPVYAADVKKRLAESESNRQKALKALESAEPTEAGAARDTLRTAEQELSDAASEARFLYGVSERNAAFVGPFSEQVDAVLADEKAEDESFRSVTDSSGWYWDKTWQKDELIDIMSDERDLASFMLGYLYMSERKYEQAAGVLSPESPAGDATAVPDYSAIAAAPLYTLYRTLLLNGASGEERASLFASEGERLSGEYPYITEVEKQAAEAWAPFEDLAPGIFFNDLPAELEELAEQLSGLEDSASDTHKELVRLLNQLSAVTDKRLERACYYLEADTYLIRYELGNYYLDAGMNLQASKQFRRVIAVDPWNISAVYKLGVVEQRYGNWSEALKYYRRVYYQDSSYENTVNYYNQLARAHADILDSSVQLVATPSKINFNGQMFYSTEFNSSLGLNIGYRIDQQRQYAGFTGQLEGVFQLHLVEAGLPVTIGTTGLKITPSAGLYVDSIFYKIDSSAALSLEEFGTGLGTYPKLGALLKWSWNPLVVDAGWEYGVEPQSLFADRELIMKNDISFNMNTWFNLEDSVLLGPLTTRTYGRLQLMSDENIKGQVYQDVMLGFNLLANPVIRISPSASVNFETSKVAGVRDYYAPDGVLEAKGGLRSAFTFPSSDWSSAFEGVLWGGSGGYWEHLGTSDFDGSLKVEGGLGTTFVKNSNMYYLNLSFSGTFADGQNEYWEVSMLLGSVLKTPGLLAP